MPKQDQRVTISTTKRQRITRITRNIRPSKRLPALVTTFVRRWEDKIKSKKLPKRLI